MISDEFALIDKIKKIVGSTQHKNVGIGDDCAIIKDISKDKDILITSDVLIENVHFLESLYSFYEIGYKSALVNASDIYAMGGLPLFYFISLGIKSTSTDKDIESFYRGFTSVSKKVGGIILGGDTARSKKDFFISITAVGSVNKGGAIVRSGAKNGDSIYVLGKIGESAYALDSYKKSKTKSRVTLKHTKPNIYYTKFLDICRKYKINSGLDISDGLCSDLNHILKNSNKSAIINRDAKWGQVNSNFKKSSEEHFKYILYGGEDYSILFTTKDKVEEDNVIKVGEIKSGSGLYLSDNGINKEIINRGYKHF